MSYSLPFVAFYFGGNSEVVSRESGFLLKPMDVRGFSSAIFNFINHSGLRNECGVQARLRVQNGFSIDRMVDDMYSVYRAVLASD